MQRLWLLLLLLTVPLAAQSDLDLVVPAGFAPTKTTEQGGNAIFSKALTREWESPDGVQVRMHLDTSYKISNALLAGKANAVIEGLRVQAKADYTVGQAFSYNEAGQNWLAIPLTANDPTTKPDQLVLYTTMEKSVAIIQVGAMRPNYAHLKAAWPAIIKLNSTPVSGRHD